jgi:hypothetical protein
MSHSHMFTRRHRFLPRTQCLGVTALLLLKVTQVTLGVDQAPLLPLRGRPNIRAWVLTSLTGSTPLTVPHWVLL